MARLQGVGLHSLGSKHVEYDGFHTCAYEISLYVSREGLPPRQNKKLLLGGLKRDEYSAICTQQQRGEPSLDTKWIIR